MVASLLLGVLLEVKGFNGAWIINIGVPLAFFSRAISGVLLQSNAQQASEAQQFLLITAVPSVIVVLLYAFLYSRRRRADSRKPMRAA